MTIGEHYSLKLFGTYLLEDFLNTMAYRQTAGTASDAASDLREQFDASVLFDIASAVNTGVAYTRLESFAIETPSDYSEETPVNDAGTRTGGSDVRVASYMAFGLRSNRNGAGTRASYKRFCGLHEADLQENELSAAFLALTAVGDLQAALSQTLVHASGNSFVPVQLKAGWTPGVAPTERFQITAYGVPYLTSQVSRRP